MNYKKVIRNALILLIIFALVGVLIMNGKQEKKVTNELKCEPVNDEMTVGYAKKVEAKCVSELEAFIRTQTTFKESLANLDQAIEEIYTRYPNIKPIETEVKSFKEIKEEKEFGLNGGCVKSAEHYGERVCDDGEESEVSLWRNQHKNPLPKVSGNTPSKRFEALTKYFGYDPMRFVNARNTYKVKEEVLACIVWSDTGFMNLKTANNPGNVGNTDSGSTLAYSSMQDGINGIARTLTNKYLGNHTRIGELSNGGRKELGIGDGYVYATSEHNWNANTLDCLTFIYGKKIDVNFRHKA